MLENVPSDMYSQQRVRSACIFLQSDQNLHCVLGQPRMQSFFVQLVGLEFNCSVNTATVMSSQSVYLTKHFLSKLSPLSG